MPNSECSFLMRWAGDMVFFSGDVKTTTIAIAITSSLCCSIVYWLVHMLHRTDDGPKSKSNGHLHLRRTISGGKGTANGTKHHRQLSRSTFTPSDICSNCSTRNFDKSCQHVLCAECCRGYKCSFHSNASTNSSSEVERQKPKELNLSYAGLESWPERLGFLGTQLRQLDLSHNNLAVLPEEIGCLLGLEELYLQHNQITDIPESIKTLSALKDLDLSNNRLATFPQYLCNLEQLVRLSVGCNNLTSIPSSIAKIRHLEELVVSSNHIKSVPKELFDLTKLKSLDLGNNHVTSLPSTIGQSLCLQTLDVSSCSLSILPPSIVKCKALVCLHLSNNMLKCLPDLIGLLKNLTKLDVSHNKLSYLPYSLVQLPLGEFKVDGNPFQTKNKSRQRSSCSRQFPSLGEISASAAATAPWRLVQELPYSLRDLLVHPSYCSVCGHRLFMQYDTCMEFVSFSEVGRELPLRQVICSNGHCVQKTASPIS